MGNGNSAKEGVDASRVLCGSVHPHPHIQSRSTIHRMKEQEKAPAASQQNSLRHCSQTRRFVDALTHSHARHSILSKTGFCPREIVYYFLFRSPHSGIHHPQSTSSHPHNTSSRPVERGGFSSFSPSSFMGLEIFYARPENSTIR